MKKKIFIIISITYASFSTAFAQQNSYITIEQYIEKFKDAAIHNMKVKKIPASITLAQGLLESGAGNSNLAKLANNHFGIKCHKDWTGDTYHQDDDAANECFRKYDNVEASFADHADFLITRPRYAKLFTFEITDYKSWAYELKNAGYATLPTYPEKLINYIEKYKLFEFDKMNNSGNVVNSNQVPEKLKDLEPIIKQVEKSPSQDLKANISVKQEIKKQEEIKVQPKPTREIKLINGSEYITARKGDTQESIARELEMAEWQIKRYNDLEAKQVLKEGDIVFISAKQEQNNEVAVHVLAEGESLHFISQKYGVKLQSLLEINHYSTENPVPGTKVNLVPETGSK